MSRKVIKTRTIILWLLLIVLVYGAGYFAARAWRDHKAEQAGESSRPAIR